VLLDYPYLLAIHFHILAAMRYRVIYWRINTLNEALFVNNKNLPQKYKTRDSHTGLNQCGL
jgi:hypothetical protein